MNEGKACQKCGHVRKADDPAPDYQCPGCGAVYAKVAAHQAGELPPPPTKPAKSPPTRLKRIATYGAALLAFAVFMELLPDSVPPPADARPTVSASSTPYTVPVPKEVDTSQTLRNIEYVATHATGDAETICAKEWTKRGVLDSRMYNHCMEQQSKGMRELEFLIGQNSASRYYDLSLLYCKREWTSRGIVNPRMMNHCMEQEIEGWKDIDYYKTIYDRELIEELAHEGVMRYSSWRMAAYHMKKALD